VVARRRSRVGSILVGAGIIGATAALFAGIALAALHARRAPAVCVLEGMCSAAPAPTRSQTPNVPAATPSLAAGPPTTVDKPSLASPSRRTTSGTAHAAQGPGPQDPTPRTPASVVLPGVNDRGARASPTQSGNINNPPWPAAPTTDGTAYVVPACPSVVPVGPGSMQLCPIPGAPGEFGKPGDVYDPRTGQEYPPPKASRGIRAEECLLQGRVPWC